MSRCILISYRLLDCLADIDHFAAHATTAQLAPLQDSVQADQTNMPTPLSH